MTSLSYKHKTLFAGLAAFFLLVVAAAAYTGLYAWIALPFIVLLLYAAWQNASLVFLLLAASLPLSVEYSLSPALSTDLPDEPLMWLSSFLFLAFAIRCPALVEKEKFRHPLVLLLIILLCWAALSSLFSLHFLLSVKYMLAKGWYVAAFVLFPFILLKTKKQVAVWTGVLLFAMLCAVLIILVRHAFTGFRFATVHEAVAPLFRNHVNYAAMLVCCVPVFVAARQLGPLIYRKLYTGILVLLLIALFFTYSRGAWLALVAGMVAYWLIKRKQLFPSFLVAVTITVLAFSWISSNDRYLRLAHDYESTIFHTDFNEHLVATYKLKDVSAAERFYRWTAAVRMIKDHPLTGTGPNTFYLEYKPYAIPAYKTWVSNNPDHSTVHNYFLLTITEQGIPGLILLLLLTGALLFYAEKLYHRIEDVFYRQVVLTAGIMLAMICTLNFLSDLIETDKIGSLFFLCLSFLVIADVNTRKKSKPAPHIESIS